MPPVRQGGNELTTRRKAFAALAIMVALALGANTAHAVPQSKTEQARAVKAEIDKLDDRVSVAAERYNEASIAHAKLLAEKKKAAARLKKVETRMGVVQKHLNVRAHNMYRSGQISYVEVLLGAQSFEEFATTWDTLRDLNEYDADAIDQLKGLRVEAEAAKREYTAKEKAAAKQVAVMRSNKRAIEQQLSERKRKLAGLESEIAAMEAADRRARAARASASVATPAAYERSFPPPTRAARSEVLSIARQYLGASYRWAASGPNSFDCSGFTMFVYRQVGVSLPHSSRAQIGVGERVSRSDLQPGDLVFFGSPIHHVGIYVGGGMMIHAPHTGAVVRIDPLHSNYAGATRP
jgi:cell wall-associated NlpC family hydrolase